MVEINASTKLTVKKPAGKRTNGAAMGKKTKPASSTRRGSVPPALKPATLATAAAVEELKGLDMEGKKNRVHDLLRKALGEQVLINKSAPHAASTSRDRAGAAADIGVAAKELGLSFVLKECGVFMELQHMLFPMGVESFLQRFADDSSSAPTSSVGLKPSASALSLASMDETTTVTSIASNGTDSNRGKTTPANAREGSLLIIRALCEIVGKPAEPFVVGAFLASALDECGSNSGPVREAGEDASVALIRLSNPWAFPAVICPVMLPLLRSTEWRVKFSVLERLQLCAALAPAQVNQLLPKLIPVITSQVFDTKQQVSKAAAATLLEICKTCTNADVAPSIPIVVKAICKPADSAKAVSELMSTTFVVPVDAGTLAILCPVLSRCLKEKLAINKRAACIVIANMSKLVQKPDDVAPFGPLLLPELKKVVENVQFEEIRDNALKALQSLTAALGDSYKETQNEDGAAKMSEEKSKIEAEQERIKKENEAEQARQAELKKKEEEERKKFKEAMDAQRKLETLEKEEQKKKKEQLAVQKDKERRSVKGAGGKCQGCGLKKCKKTCLFFGQQK